VGGAVGLATGAAIGAASRPAPAPVVVAPAPVVVAPAPVVVAAPPVGTVVAVLPGGCVSAGAVFTCGAVRYQAFYQNNQVVYQVVP
jgi:hypothetical protein